MVWQTLGLFKSFIYYDSVIIDDFIFRFHYSFTSYVILFASLLVTGKIYLGDPIHCSLGMSDYTRLVSQNMLDSYCYIHSTFTIPTANETGKHSYPGVGPHTSEEKETQAVYHSYYQWVPLILLLQGMAFFVPRLLWYKLEDGTVKGLRMELNLPYLDTDKQAEHVTRLVGYLEKTVGRHHKYGRDYFICMFLNIANVVLQESIHTPYSEAYRHREALVCLCHLATGGVWKPAYVTFGCHMHLFGPSGTMQNLDGLCVLPLNILHDKIYLILWFWYFVLLAMTLLQFMYWLRFKCFPTQRLAHIINHVKAPVGGNTLAPFNTNFGDWFLLHQIYKNVTYPNYIKIIDELAGVDEFDVAEKLLKGSEVNIDFEAASPGLMSSKLASRRVSPQASRRVSKAS